MQLKSIFQEISESVFNIPDLGKAQTFIKEFVVAKDINPKDRNTIIRTVDACPNIYKL